MIGSGAAGLGATLGLIDRGRDVALLDVGTTLQPDIDSAVREIAGRPPSSWTNADYNRLKLPLMPSNGLPRKLTYGSDYAYPPSDDSLIASQEDFGGFYSLAKGGLTNVWGTAMLPYRGQDIRDWPIGVDELEEHYAAILRHVPLSGRNDALDELFPHPCAAYTHLQPAPQTRSLCTLTKKQELALMKRGIYAGTSRLAFRPRTDWSSDGCQACGLCFYGCPFGVMYSSRFTIDDLVSSGRCQYLDRRRLIGFEERSDGLTLTVQNLREDRVETIECDYVYIAAGVLPTAKIVLESTRQYGRIVKAEDSQAFLCPFFNFDGIDGLRTASSHTMAQAFIDCIDGTGYASHLQVYPYLDVVDSMLEKAIPRWIVRGKIFSDKILSHMVIIQGFLHSKFSGSFEISLNGGGGMKIVGKRSKESRREVKRVLKWLVGSRNELGGLPILAGLQMFKPGAGQHFGGTFPMRESPGELQCDPQGGLFGFRRVKLVDASTFPSIPATTIAFAAMANAYRISSIA